MVNNMKLIEKIEDQILELSDEERLENLKDISYFIQCAAQMRKAENDKGASAPKQSKLNMEAFKANAKKTD